MLEETLETERKRRSDNADEEQIAKRQKVQEEVNDFMGTLASLAGKTADPLQDIGYDWF